MTINCIHLCFSGIDFVHLLGYVGPHDASSG